MSGEEDKAELLQAEEPTTSTTAEDDEAGKDGEEDTGAHIAPIVKLEEVSISTGEESETVLFEIKSKLYRFDKEGNQWKERGVGQTKLLEHNDTKKIRLLMRQQRTLKICANHIVLPGTELQEHAGSDKSWVWHANDFADGELKEELFTMRFGSIDSAQNFKTAYEEAQEKMKAVLGLGEGKEEADEAAEALGSLEVGDKEKVEVVKSETEATQTKEEDEANSPK